MKKKPALPAMPLYIGDWKKDPGVCAMSKKPEDEGIYLRLLMICWESENRGYLQIGGKPIPHNILADMINLDNQKLSKWLTVYQDMFKIFGETEEGILFSKKHVEIVELSKKRKQAGERGGNPVLLNQKDNQMSSKRITKSEASGYPNTENENENENEDEIVSESKMWIKHIKKCGYFKTAKPDLLKYCDSIDKLIRIDKLKLVDISNIREFLELDISNGDFSWTKIIGSPAKLRVFDRSKTRKHWESIRIAMGPTKSKGEQALEDYEREYKGEPRI